LVTQLSAKLYFLRVNFPPSLPSVFLLSTFYFSAVPLLRDSVAPCEPQCLPPYFYFLLSTFYFSAVPLSVPPWLRVSLSAFPRISTFCFLLFTLLSGSPQATRSRRQNGRNTGDSVAFPCSGNSCAERKDSWGNKLEWPGGQSMTVVPFPPW